jgi:CotH protein.
MIGFILGSDMANPGAFAQAETLMDMESFIDFQIAHMYARNTDWPGNNINYWVYLDGQPGEGVPYGQDGRWRWMIYDTDFGLGLNFDYVNNSGTYGGNNAYHNTLAFALAENGPGWPNPPWSTALMRALLESSEFERRFVTRFADLLNTNYRRERAQAMVQEFRSTLLPEIDEHIARWREPSRAYWESDISTMESFVLARESGIRNHIDSYFGLGGAVEISVDVNDAQRGFVKVNTVEIREGVAGVGAGTVGASNVASTSVARADASGVTSGTTDPYPWSGTYFSRNAR